MQKYENQVLIKQQWKEAQYFFFMVSKSLHVKNLSIWDS